MGPKQLLRLRSKLEMPIKNVYISPSICVSSADLQPGLDHLLLNKTRTKDNGYVPEILVKVLEALDEEVGPEGGALQQLVAVPVQHVHRVQLTILALKLNIFQQAETTKAMQFMSN